jgi:hypothetical protein
MASTLAHNYTFRQVRGWQLKKLMATVNSMHNMGFYIPSEVILYREGEKGCSNIEDTLKAIGIEPTKMYHVGPHKMSGETILLKAAAIDKETRKNSLKVICDGNHKAMAIILLWIIAGIEMKPIDFPVAPELADRFADEANLIQRTSALLANEETLEAIVRLRKLGVYKIQANLPFAKEERLPFQNYWWRSEAVVNHGYRTDQVAKLHWPIAKALCEGQTMEQALAAGDAKKNAPKVVSAESIKMAEKMAINGDTEGKEELTAILKAAAAGDNDLFKRLVSEFYSKRKVAITAVA